MKLLNISIPIKVHQEHELGDTDRELIAKAKAVAENAYAPYSHFHVGASALLADGTVVVGSNQENAAYPSGTCAERTALFSANACYPDQSVKTLVVVARTAQGYLANPISPCGSCRQVLIEVERRYNQPMRILLYGTSGVYELEKAADLLPLTFTGEDLPDAE